MPRELAVPVAEAERARQVPEATPLTTPVAVRERAARPVLEAARRAVRAVRMPLTVRCRVAVQVQGRELSASIRRTHAPRHIPIRVLMVQTQTKRLTITARHIRVATVATLTTAGQRHGLNSIIRRFNPTYLASVFRQLRSGLITTIAGTIVA